MASYFLLSHFEPVRHVSDPVFRAARKVSRKRLKHYGHDTSGAKPNHRRIEEHEQLPARVCSNVQLCNYALSRMKPCGIPECNSSKVLKPTKGMPLWSFVWLQDDLIPWELLRPDIQPLQDHRRSLLTKAPYLGN